MTRFYKCKKKTDRLLHVVVLKEANGYKKGTASLRKQFLSKIYENFSLLQQSLFFRSIGQCSNQEIVELGY